MAQLQQRVEIARPLEEVFALVANLGIGAWWSWDLVEVGQVTSGPLGAGFRYLARLGGRRFELVGEVTRYERNRRRAVKPVSGPIRSGGVLALEAIPGGTRITFGGSGRAGCFLSLAEPPQLRAAQRPLRSDLANLKRLRKGQPQD
jgi:hypothetical protein